MNDEEDIVNDIKWAFLACGHIERECPIRDDIYNIDLNDIDPGAVIQGITCEIG